MKTDEFKFFSGHEVGSQPDTAHDAKPAGPGQLDCSGKDEGRPTSPFRCLHPDAVVHNGTAAPDPAHCSWYGNFLFFKYYCSGFNVMGC